MNNTASSRQTIRYSLAALLTLVTFCGFGSCVLRAVVFRVTAENTTAQQANKLLWHVGSPLLIPDTANNVTLLASYSRTSATFEMQKQDFEQWASDWHWKLEPISGGQCKAMDGLAQCFHRNFPSSIANGYSFSNSSNRGGWDVVYDQDEKRVWVSYGRH